MAKMVTDIGEGRGETRAAKVGHHFARSQSPQNGTILCLSDRLYGTWRMSMIPSIGFKRPIRFWTALVFFAVAAGYVYENCLVQNGISSLSLDEENLASS